jgi:hypothetical protein
MALAILLPCYLGRLLRDIGKPSVSESVLAIFRMLAISVLATNDHGPPTVTVYYDIPPLGIYMVYTWYMIPTIYLVGVPDASLSPASISVPDMEGLYIRRRHISHGPAVIMDS